MAMQTWETLVNAYQTSGASSGAAYNTSETLTDISPGGKEPGQALTIAGSFLVPGNILRYTAAGVFSTAAASKPLITVGLYYGGVAGTALASIKLETPEGVTNVPWRMEATSRVVSAGKTGKLMTQGLVYGLVTPKQSEKVSASLSHMPETASGGNEVAVETGVANILTVGAKWGTNSASNTITCFQWLVEILN